MFDPMRPVLCIQGPTASGKSELAERVSESLGAEIVSADSMQIYRGMDIGTAKVPAHERRVKYHCIDIVDPGQPYSAALFQQDARKAFEDIYGAGKIPVLCGGTGFYVRAALDDMDFAEGSEEDPFRIELQERAVRIGSEAMHEELAKVDPESASMIHPNDMKRVIRALEMANADDSYAARKSRFKSIRPYISSVRFALDVDRKVLYERIDSRVDEMVAAGLVEEVEGLLARGFRDALTAAQAIGYKEMVACLDGSMSFEEALEKIKRSTRRYAKRQLTWLRGDDSVIWMDADEGIDDALVAAVVDAYEKAVGE